MAENGGNQMKKLKDWRLLLLLGFALSYGMLLMTMINDFYELPSEGFSKEVILREYEKPNTYNAYDDKGFTSGALKEGFYLLVNDGDSLVYETYTVEGKLQSSEVIKSGIDTVTDISADIIDDEIKYVMATEKEVFAGRILVSSGKLVQDERIAETYEQVVLKKNEAVFSKEDAFYYFKESVKTLFTDDTIKRFDFVSVGDQLYLTTLSRDGGSYYSDYYVCDLGQGAYEKVFVREYMTANATKDADHKMIMLDQELRVMNIFRDSKTNNTFYKEVTFDKKDVSTQTIEKFEMPDYPNFKYVEKADGRPDMIFEEFTFVGKDEIASGNNTYRNLVFYDESGDTTVKRQLTKMKKAHPVYQYFQVNNNDYLVFNAVDRDSLKSIGTIYFGTTDPIVVKKSNALDNENLMALVFGALTVIPAALAVGFIPSMGYLFPVILVIMPLSMIKITWAERYPDKMLRVAIGVYVASLLYGFYDTAVMITGKIVSIAGSLPWHLQSVLNMYLMLAFVFVVAYLGYKWFYAKHPKVSFMVHFGVLFITFSTLYIMLFQTYPLLSN